MIQSARTETQALENGIMLRMNISGFHHAKISLTVRDDYLSVHAAHNIYMDRDYSSQF